LAPDGSPKCAPALVLDGGGTGNLEQDNGDTKVIAASEEGVPSGEPGCPKRQRGREDAARSYNERQDADNEERHRTHGEESVARERP